MIPKNSTPIKNDILIDIFAKGLLNKDEMRIIFYIIRWSWGFDGIERRQDWTKKLTKRKIADDIEMKESQFNRTINKMVIENKIIIKEGCYQFNEHYEKWVNLTKSKVSNNKKLNKKLSKTSQIVKVNLTKSKVKLNKLSSSTDLKPLQNKPLPDRKETLKETNTKETLKEKGTNFIKAWKNYKNMRKKIKKPMTEYAEELIIKKLNKLSDNENIQIAILNQSIMNSWQGIYPLKGDQIGRSNQNNNQSEKPGIDKYKHLEEEYKV